MRSTSSSRPSPFTSRFTFAKVWLVGVLVASGWAGCQANTDGFVDPAQGGKTSGTTGAAGQFGGGLATGGQADQGGGVAGSPAFDAGISAITDGALGGSPLPQSTGGLARDAGNTGLPDAASGPDGKPGTGGAGGQSPGTAGVGGSMVPDAGQAGIDAPLGGTTNTSSKAGGGSGAVSAGGSVSITGGSSDGAMGGASGSATGGALSLLDAGIDAGLAPDATVPADTARGDTVDMSMWRLVWSDEFDREANAGATASKWNVSTWDPGTVNNEEQKYTARTQNVFHDGEGHLFLRGLHDSYTVGPATYPYTSGRIQTDGNFEFKFGRVEIRAKLPAGQGSFPGMILMGTNGDWPGCGEIALMEQRGQDKASVYCTTYSDSQNGVSKKVTFPSATTLSTEFHTYALEWYADHMLFFIDGTEVARREFNASSPFSADNNNFYIILDVALGGSMGGTIDDTAFPMDMILDYVRVYSLIAV